LERFSVISSPADASATGIDSVLGESTASFRPMAASKLLARRREAIGENRLELLTVEVQEERERLLRARLLTLGAAAFSLLARMTLN
jgi:hypothetical protein